MSEVREYLTVHGCAMALTTVIVAATVAVGDAV